MFEKAVREKYRFPSTQGALAVEDLFDLSLSHLDNIAQYLNKLVNDQQTAQSFISVKSTDDSLQTKFEIVKYIIQEKLNAREAASKARENKEKKQQLLVLISQKENEALTSKTVDELRAMVEALA